MIKIIFICHGNICRSPMAEFVLKDMVEKQNIADGFMIDSCATSREEIGNDIHEGTKRKLREEGIPFEKHHARQLTQKDYDTYDYLIYMDQMNLRNMHRLIGGDPLHKMHLLTEFEEKDKDIADPWYTGNFDETYQDIKDGCQALLHHVLNTAN